MELSRPDKIRCAIMGRLPSMGDKLPICGRFYKDRVWTGAYPLEAVYPKWFVACCRIEAAVYVFLYKLCMRGV